MRQLDWAAGPGGGDEDDEVPVTDSGNLTSLIMIQHGSSLN